jgi:RNA polymerase-binding transcription factor DksA
MKDLIKGKLIILKKIAEENKKGLFIKNYMAKTEAEFLEEYKDEENDDGNEITLTMDAYNRIDIATEDEDSRLETTFNYQQIKHLSKVLNSFIEAVEELKKEGKNG